jgi:hypothetical protein
MHQEPRRGLAFSEYSACQGGASCTQQPGPGDERITADPRQRIRCAAAVIWPRQHPTSLARRLVPPSRRRRQRRVLARLLCDLNLFMV